MGRKRKKQEPFRFKFKQLAEEVLDILPSTKIVIPQDVVTQLARWQWMAGSYEISGTGVFDTLQDDDVTKYLLRVLWLNSNLSGSGSVTQFGEQIAESYLKADDLGYGPENVFYWHTHASGNAFWSTIDQKAAGKTAGTNYPQLSVCFGGGKSIVARQDQLVDDKLVSNSIATVLLLPQDWLDELNLIEEAKERERQLAAERSERLLAKYRAARPEDGNWSHSNWGWAHWLLGYDPDEPDDRWPEPSSNGWDYVPGSGRWVEDENGVFTWEPG